MTNAERQRAFRRRNPGYYARLKARERAACKAYVEARLAADRAAAAAAAATIVNTYRTMPLMLPAPVETIDIPGITTIRVRDAVPARELIEARRRDAA